MRSMLSTWRCCDYRRLLPVLIVIVGSVGTANIVAAADWRFSVRMAPEVRSEPLTGRVYLFFTSNPTKEPRKGPDWIHPEPFVSLDVQNWNPREPLSISPATPRLLSFPRPLAELDLGKSRVQAVVRLNPHARDVGNGTGNGMSSTIADVTEVAGPGIELTVDRLVTEPKFQSTERTREIVVRSKLLSDFHQREVSLRGGVQLPASYASSPDRRYPVMFNVPGFGGTHFSVSGKMPPNDQNAQGVEFIRVTLDPSCGRGHHVFADSANNGPVGQALVTEFIPQLDAEYRTIAAPTARFLTGHSSGGWSTLWLQTTYPDTFGGTWSTSPDSVTFSDFQRVDIHAPNANMYRDEAGRRRPIGHSGDTILLWTDSFSDMETVLGPGGQLASFEAVFSPRGADGQPVQVWDRRTGAIDHEVAETWKRYDIRLRLLANWPTIGPRLTGKLHVFMGSEDTFYLDGATRKLKATLAELHSDAVVEILPGKDHFNLFADGLDKRIRQEMVETFLKHHPAPAK